MDHREYERRQGVERGCSTAAVAYERTLALLISIRVAHLQSLGAPRGGQSASIANGRKRSSAIIAELKVNGCAEIQPTYRSSRPRFTLCQSAVLGCRCEP